MSESDSITTPPSPPTDTAPKTWPEFIPEPLRKPEYEGLTKFKDTGDLAKSYMELQKLQGGMVRIPGEKDSPDAWAKWDKQIGVPDTADGYNIQIEGSDEEFVKDVKLLGKQYHIPEKALKGLFEGVTNKQREKIAAIESESARRAEAYEQKAKEVFKDRYGENLAIAQRQFAKLPGVDDDLVKALAESGLDRHPALIKALVSDAIVSNGGKLPEGNGAGSFGTSAEDISAKLDEIVGSRLTPAERANLPYWNQFHPDHKSVRKKHDALASQLAAAR